MNNSNYLYRRQYILGPKYIQKFTNWNKTKINDNLYITSHPDLNITTRENDNIQITLLGYIIDYKNTDYNNEQILDELISKSNNIEDFINNTYSFSGRWILIYNDYKQIITINDPGGTRQLYYTTKDNQLWAASQPHLIANELYINKTENSDILNFIKSPYFDIAECQWVGDESLYENINHMLPNHYLNLNSGEIKRYWTDFEKDEINVQQAIKDVSYILEKSILALNERNNQLMMGISAGVDSRCLLAASKDIKDEIYFFVSTKNVLGLNHMDIKTPKLLLDKLNLKLDIFENIEKPTDEFISTLKENVPMARQLPKTLTIYNIFKYHQDKVGVSGNMSGITKHNVLGKNINNQYLDEITGEDLAQALGYTNIKYAKEQLDKWLEDVKPLCRETGFDIGTLLYWEQRIGNWAAMYYSELDIAIEEFCPFNNRELIIKMNKVNTELRSSPNYELNKNLVEYMWKETLLVPINPLSKKDKIKKKIVNLMPISLKNKVKILLKGNR